MENYRSLLEISAYDDDFVLQGLIGGRAAAKVLVSRKEVKAVPHVRSVPHGPIIRSSRHPTSGYMLSLLLCFVEEELS